MELRRVSLSGLTLSGFLNLEVQGVFQRGLVWKSGNSEKVIGLLRNTP